MAGNNIYVVDGDDQSLTQIAREQGLSLSQLLVMNPDVDPEAFIHEGDELVIPSHGYNYTVGPDEILSKIASDKGVSVSAILAANPDIPDANSVREGQSIFIPQEYFVYTVQRGDWNTSMLAERFSDMYVSAADIARVNPTVPEDGRLMLGQELTIPTGYMSHTVRGGEYLTSIGRDRYNLTLSEMQAANPQLAASDWGVRERQIIRIPSPGLLRDFTVAADALADAEISDRNFPSAYNIPDGPVQRAWSTAIRGDVHPPVADNPNAPPLIVLDLGHGSINEVGWYDAGKVSTDEEVREVDIVDPVAANLALQLAERGYQVAFTRNPGEVFLLQGAKGGPDGRLAVRAKHAINLERELAAPYTVLVSIHVNAASSRSASGLEVYTPRRADGSQFFTNSSRLGQLIGSTTSNSIAPVDFRRMTTGNLGVLRNFGDQAYGNDAAVLVELGFLTNPDDRVDLENMRDRPFRIAADIRRGIEAYIEEKSPGLTLTQTASPMGTIPEGPG